MNKIRSCSCTVCDWNKEQEQSVKQFTEAGYGYALFRQVLLKLIVFKCVSTIV